MDLLQTVLNAQKGAAVAESGRTLGLDQAKRSRRSGSFCPPSQPVCRQTEPSAGQGGTQAAGPGVLGVLAPAHSNKDGSVADV